MYEVRVTRQFIRATRRTAREDMDAAMDAIIADPFNARGSHLLAHDWSGFRGADFTGRERIIYRVCEECVRRQQTLISPLACCAQEDRNPLVITFVDFGDYHQTAGRRRIRPARAYDID
jgi:mRNA-degrading endonuclease YafQ of YafQ-DinJ toxin-antitoxin module